MCVYLISNPAVVILWVNCLVISTTCAYTWPEEGSAIISHLIKTQSARPLQSLWDHSRHTRRVPIPKNKNHLLIATSASLLCSVAVYVTWRQCGVRQYVVVWFPDWPSYCQLGGCWLMLQLQFYIICCLNVSFVWYVLQIRSRASFFFIFLWAHYSWIGRTPSRNTQKSTASCYVAQRKQRKKTKNKARGPLFGRNENQSIR